MPKGGQSLLDLTKLPEGADEQVLANVVVEGEPPVAVMPAAASRHALYESCTKDVADFTRSGASEKDRAVHGLLRC